MSFSQSGPLATSIFKDVELDDSGEILVAEAAVLYGFEIDNTANSLPSFVKIYNKATAPNPGDDDPLFIFKVKAGSKLPIPFGAVGEGYSFDTGLSVACVTTGGKGGTTPPANKVVGVFHTD